MGASGVMAHRGLLLKSNALAANWFDDFSSAGTLASYSQQADVGGTVTWAIASGELTANGATATQAELIYSGLTFGNGYVESNILESDNAGLIGRFVDQNNFYVLNVRDASSIYAPNTWELYRRVSSTFTLLGGGALSAWTRGVSRKFKLNMVGTGANNITVYDGVTLLGTISDSSIASGKWGLGGYQPGVTKFTDILIQP